MHLSLTERYAQQQPHKQHVARSFSQYAVQLFAAVYGNHLPPRQCMQVEVNAGSPDKFE